ncbi:uncharacterized protein N7459_003478 [Penicillium hispanicum]|uniref:uncharacterized protein n=1 Tax=Penicillium hispanicum TaxID=1080232 RepID=UPI00253FAAC7|nr:uncharacterized protein N7459_003478 [Penicillium hispanicum]KAJ5587713.1 hypothetical protein N7459_003478 [Penicillium hispanicum]
MPPQTSSSSSGSSRPSVNSSTKTVSSRSSAPDVPVQNTKPTQKEHNTRGKAQGTKRKARETSTDPTVLPATKKPGKANAKEKPKNKKPAAKGHNKKAAENTNTNPPKDVYSSEPSSPEPEGYSGSPWDPTERKKLNVDDLDLEISYVGKYRLPEANKTRPPRQPRWKAPRNKPVTDVSRLPAGWNDMEPDLDPDDLENQIIRCKERIKDGILPYIFEQRLKEFEQAMNRRRYVFQLAIIHRKMGECEPQGLSWPVIQRLDCLKIIAKSLQSKGDPREQLPNVQSIMSAYRTRQIDWCGLVTYWSQGQQLCEPRPFDWDEFEAINLKYKGHKSFWVEGIMDPGPQLQLPNMKIPMGGHGRHFPYFYRVGLRFPGCGFWTRREYVYDTGSDCMDIYEADVAAIMGPYVPDVPILGETAIQSSNGQYSVRSIFEIEVTILNEDLNRLSPWFRVQCAVKPGMWDPDKGIRCDGPWLRHALYTGTAPDASKNLHFSTSRRSLRLPTASNQDRTVPRTLNTVAPHPGEEKVLYPLPPYEQRSENEALPTYGQALIPASKWWPDPEIGIDSREVVMRDANDDPSAKNP